MSWQIQGDSKEAVAYGLMQCVLLAQGRANQEHVFVAGSTLLRGQSACTEQEVLALYARCLRTVRGEDQMTLPATDMRPQEAAALHS